MNVRANDHQSFSECVCAKCKRSRSSSLSSVYNSIAIITSIIFYTSILFAFFLYLRYAHCAHTHLRNDGTDDVCMQMLRTSRLQKARTQNRTEKEIDTSKSKTKKNMAVSLFAQQFCAFFSLFFSLKNV